MKSLDILGYTVSDVWEKGSQEDKLGTKWQKTDRGYGGLDWKWNDLDISYRISLIW